MLPAMVRPPLVCLWATSCLGLVACGDARASDGRFAFVDVAASAGLDVVGVSGDPRRWYIPESNGSGAAFLDHDLDGDMDLFVGNGARFEYVDDGRRLEIVDRAPSRMYANRGDWVFEDVSEAAGLARRDWVNGVTVGDVDNDGDPDLYLACFGPDVFLRNEAGRFVDATAETGLGNEAWAAGAVFGDTNRDGFLDLYVANYVVFDPEAPPDGGRRAVYEGVELGWGPEEENGQGFNEGAPDRFFLGAASGRFREATEEAGFALDKALCSYAAVFTDVDLDGDPDLLVTNDLQPCNLFVNDGSGHFADEALERGFAFDGSGAATAAMGLAVADVDRDGDPDVLRTNFDMETNTLLVNDGSGRFRDATAGSGLGEASFDVLGWAAALFDADLDGDLDALIANGHVLPQAEQVGMHPWLQRTQFFEGSLEDGVATWTERTTRAGPGLAGVYAARGLALADVDEDGDLDALVVDIDGPPRLLRNDSKRAGHWLSVRTLGRSSNRDAIGARVVVVTREGRSFTREVMRTQGLYSSHDPRAHFGLGETAGLERVEIHWPSGLRQTLPALELDQMHVVTEPEPEDL